MFYVFEYVSCFALFRSVQSDFEPDCPRVPSVSVLDFVWRYGNDVDSPEIIQVWENVPWKLDGR